PKLILLARRSRKRERSCELATSFRCIKSQEVDRLAHFENRIDQGLAGLANAEREEFLAMLFVKVGGAIEQFRARFAAKRVPADLRGARGPNHAFDVLCGGFEDGAHFDPPVLRRSDGPSLALSEC